MVADTVCRRVVAAFLASMAEDFTWSCVIGGVQANVMLAHSIAFAALVMLLWSRKVKVGGLSAAILVVSVLCAMLPRLPPYASRSMHDHEGKKKHSSEAELRVLARRRALRSATVPGAML